MNEEYNKVKSFHRKFLLPIADIPTLLNNERTLIRTGWMKEELEEFILSKDIADQTDAIIDLIYYALGTLVEMGVSPDNFFDIVHNANMKKISKDNIIIYGEGNKVEKPKEWCDPKNLIIKEIENQLIGEKNND